MLDLILRNANLPDGRRGCDIAVQDGRIVELAPAISAQPARRSMPPVAWRHRPSWTAISTWTPP